MALNSWNLGAFFCYSFTSSTKAQGLEKKTTQHLTTSLFSTKHLQPRHVLRVLQELTPIQPVSNVKAAVVGVSQLTCSCVCEDNYE